MLNVSVSNETSLPNTNYYTFQVDVSAAFAYLIAPKDDNEISIMKKASMVSVDVFNKYLKEKIMEIIDSEKVMYLFYNSTLNRV